MDSCCDAKGEELAQIAHGSRRRVLLIVLAINSVMFVTEFGAGVVSRSTALMADSVDMLGDALVYGMSLYALSRSQRWKAGAALVKGGVILLFGSWIIAEVVEKIMKGVTPISSLMGTFGAIALVANGACLALLWRHRDDDVNMSSTFECSMNDVAASIGVLLAAAGVWLTRQSWPDIAVGTVVAALFLRSAVLVIRRAWPEVRLVSV